MTPDGDLPPLDILLSNEALQPPELWFDSHITPLDYFKLYAKTIPIIIGEDVYFEECVVRVGRRQFPLDIAAETKMIREAMNKTWTMNLKGRAFSFTARFDRYAEFIPHGTSRRYDVVRSLTNEFFFENESPPRSRYYLLESSDDATPDVTLKKTHFCERVRLSRSEWEGGYQEIRLYLDSEGPTVGKHHTSKLR